MVVSTTSSSSSIVVPSFSSSRDAWVLIEKLFYDQASSRILQLKVQFHNLKKGELSITDYVHKLKTIYDSLAAIGSPLSENDLVMQILSSLPSEYLSINAALSTKIPLPSFSETRSSLFTHELHLSGLSPTLSPSPSPAIALIAASTAPASPPSSNQRGRGRGRNNRGRGRGFGGRGRGYSLPNYYAPPVSYPYVPWPHQ